MDLKAIKKVIYLFIDYETHQKLRKSLYLLCLSEEIKTITEQTVPVNQDVSRPWQTVNATLLVERYIKTKKAISTNTTRVRFILVTRLEMTYYYC